MKILASVATFVVLTLAGHALGISWPWALAWGAVFGAMTAAALLLAKTARPRDPRPWLVSAGAVSLLPVGVTLVRGASFETSTLLSGATALILFAAAASVRRKQA